MVVDRLKRLFRIDPHSRRRLIIQNLTLHRSRNLNNLISINRLPFQPSKPSTKLLQFCVLNARSINNKTLHIKDYVVDNKIDILAITETWLKSDDDCYFTIRDICPQDYVFNHIPRTTGTGGGVGLLFKKNLKIKKLQTWIFRSFELMEVVKNQKIVSRAHFFTRVRSRKTCWFWDSAIHSSVRLKGKSYYSVSQPRWYWPFCRLRTIGRIFLHV